MSCERTPEFLGAYLLGALAPEERQAADEHLRECPVCAAELAELRAVPTQLGRLELADLESVAPPSDLFDRVTAAARRRRARGRRWLAGAAAAVVVGAGVGTWALVRDDGTARSVTSGTVRLAVVATEAGNGTGLEVTVGGLPRGEQCRLLVQDEAGDWFPAAEWTVDYVGEASYDVWTEVDPADLEELLLLGVGDRELARLTF